MVLPPLTVTLQAQSGSVTLMVLVFTASGPRVSGCPATRPAAGAPSAVPLGARARGGVADSGLGWQISCNLKTASRITL